MIQPINIQDAIDEFDRHSVIDVRSPGEYNDGHIPGAFNIPLFSDEERAEIGIAYKQISKNAAIKLGEKFAHPKRGELLAKARDIHQNKGLIIHCWRGGMRSAEMAKFLSENNLNNIKVLDNGYKSYRKLAQRHFESTLNLRLLGGYTGSGKTAILAKLREKGHQVIDLEDLANHKGSAFGWIGENAQPTSEQFENDLFWKLRKYNSKEPIWLEDESRNIGSVYLPEKLFNQMKSVDLYFLNIPRNDRAIYLAENYGTYMKEDLAVGINKISKRLGGLSTKEALLALSENDFYSVAQIALNYYDKSYRRGLKRRDASTVREIKLSSTDVSINTNQIIEFIEKHERNTTNTV